MTIAIDKVEDDHVTNITSMDPDVWMEILHTPGPYANAEEEAACLVSFLPTTAQAYALILSLEESSAYLLMQGQGFL